MNGLELCRRYFHEVGLPRLRALFPEWLDRIACGLIGPGSEVFGLDDDFSRDHNWGPRFWVFLSPDHYAEVGERMRDTLLAELPDQYLGHRLQRFPPGKGQRHVRVENLRSFATWALGYPEVPDDDVAWLGIPENRLFEIHAGEIWHDPQRLLLGLRDATAYFPEMVWRKRMAFFWEGLFFAHNFVRSAVRGDRIAEQMYLAWALHCLMRIAFLLNRRYAPYRKWLHRAFLQLPLLADGLDPMLTQMMDGASPSAKRDAFRGALEILGRATNELGIISPQSFDAETPVATFVDFNCYGFANAIQESITGPLAKLSYADGAPDQWAFDLGTAKPLRHPDIVRALFSEACAADVKEK